MEVELGKEFRSNSLTSVYAWEVKVDDVYVLLSLGGNRSSVTLKFGYESFCVSAHKGYPFFNVLEKAKKEDAESLMTIAMSYLKPNQLLQMFKNVSNEGKRQGRNEVRRNIKNLIMEE